MCMMFSDHAIKVPILNLKVSHSSDIMIGYFWQCRPPMDDDKDPNESVFKHPEDTSGPYVASLLPVLPPGPLLGIHAAHVTLHPHSTLRQDRTAAVFWRDIPN